MLCSSRQLPIDTFQSPFDASPSPFNNYSSPFASPPSHFRACHYHFYTFPSSFNASLSHFSTASSFFNASPLPFDTSLSPLIASQLPFHPLNAELLGTLASPPLNSWEGGGEKNKYLVMLDLYEDTNRILAYEQIITWEGVVLYWWITPRSCQGHIKVIWRSKSQNFLEIPTFYQFQAV